MGTTVNNQLGFAVVEAHDMLKRDHSRGLQRLNALFRSGSLPESPLYGAFDGQLITTILGAGLDKGVRGIAAFYMPWRGKIFDTYGGENLFTAASKLLITPFDPNVQEEEPDFVRAYPFRTYSGKGIIDRDRDVLKIDYDLPANPFSPIRHVLDELVELEKGYYFGKAHFRFGKHWRTVAYFSLQERRG